MVKSILFNQKEKRKEKHTSTPFNITSLKFITVHFYHMVPIQKKKIITWIESKSVNIQMFSFLINITNKLITILAL